MSEVPRYTLWADASRHFQRDPRVLRFGYRFSSLIRKRPPSYDPLRAYA